ncbi:MAG: GxxExxY protein [Planctomycetaceae bacterium]|nr:GxxExxY protein [Planctomycetaceae bacterium]
MGQQFDPIPDRANQVAKEVVDAAIAVHRALGPGLIESVYRVCLCHELSKRGLAFRHELDLPVVHDGVRLESGLRIDILVDECVIVETKAVEKLHPVHEAQILTYPKLTGCRLGLLINFNVPLLKDGIKRIVH